LDILAQKGFESRIVKKGRLDGNHVGRIDRLEIGMV
jgi:hypothetical protein